MPSPSPRNGAVNLAILFQSDRLKISKSLPDAGALLIELQNFKMKISTAGKEGYEAWRESDHDDMVLAAAIAAWYGEKVAGSIFNPPPLPTPPSKPRLLQDMTYDEIMPKLGAARRPSRI